MEREDLAGGEPLLVAEELGEVADAPARLAIAEGAAEAMFETGPQTYDLAAPLVLVEEAGGRFTDMTGARRIDAGCAVATNGLLHEEVVRLLAGPGPT